MRISKAGSATSDDRSVEAAIASERVRLLRMARAIVGSAELAEDVVQEASLRAIQTVSRPVPSAIKPWLRSITVRCALSALSRTPDGTTIAEPGAICCDGLNLRLAVEDTLSRLTPEQRTLLALTVSEGWKYQEIAEALEIPVGTVASRLFAAKEAFRKLWEDE